MKTTVRPLCDRCRDSASPGHLEDPVTGAVLGRCPCRHLEATPQQQRDAAMAAAAAAHPGSMQAALALIRDAARQHPTLSANTIRDILDVARIPGPVRGPAFAASKNPNSEDNYCLELIGQEPSGRGSRAKGHRVDLYRSLIYRGAA